MIISINVVISLDKLQLICSTNNKMYMHLIIMFAVSCSKYHSPKTRE